MQITVDIPDDKKEEDYWVLPFNNLETPKDGAVFLYLRNTGILPIELEKVKISSTSKISTIQIHSVLGEPNFVREQDIAPKNKSTWRNGIVPDIEVKTCAECTEVYSIGQLDRIDLPKESTTYNSECDIVIGPDSIIVFTASTLGRLSGIVTISQEIEAEEE